MGLRAAIITTVILGFTTAAAADAKQPAKAEPAKAVKKPGDGKTAERPDPAAVADAAKAAQPAKAAGSDAEEADSGDAPGDAADEYAELAMPHVVGPKHVELGNNTSIDLPDGMMMLEHTEAQALLRKSGEQADHVVAIVFKPDFTWRASILYADSGYIDDSDADDLDAGDLLESYRKGTEEQNKVRKSLGVPELVIDSWSEAPRYERSVHHLAWGINAHAVDGKVINFITRILGRNGFLSVTLVDEPEQIALAKQQSLPIIQAMHFNAGSTYADHVSSDRSSGMGLRGLVLGGAGVAVASKLGLLAKILIFFKKGFILIFAALAGLFGKIFRRKRDPAGDPGDLGVAAPTAVPPTSPPPMSPPPIGGPGDPHDGSSG
jgi:uncharacterized membrane-anchored protein